MFKPLIEAPTVTTINGTAAANTLNGTSGDDIINGLGVAGLPPYSLGYVNLVNAGILAAVTVPMAQVGVRLAHRVSGIQLRDAMVLMMCFFGLKMLGVLSWLGLPL